MAGQSIVGHFKEKQIMAKQVRSGQGSAEYGRARKGRAWEARAYYGMARKGRGWNILAGKHMTGPDGQGREWQT